MSISCVLIAKNEERNIESSLRSVDFCSEKIVVDGISTDDTVVLAERSGAQVYRRLFTTFSEQKNFGIQKATADWLLLLDADERVSPALADEIMRATSSNRHDGYWLPRKNRLFRHWMRFNQNGKDWQLRLLRRGWGQFEGQVHERIRCRGKIGRLKNPLLHESTSSLTAYMAKLNHYTELEVQNGRRSLAPAKCFLGVFYRLFLKGGILDGMAGIIFSVLSAYYDFICYAKDWEAGHGKTV